MPGYADSLTIEITAPSGIDLPASFTNPSTLNRAVDQLLVKGLVPSATPYLLHMEAITDGVVVGDADRLVTIKPGSSQSIDVSANLDSKVDHIEIQGATALFTGSSTTLVATAFDEFNSVLFDGAGFTWSSSDTTLLSVDELSGQVSALVGGLVTVSAQLIGTSHSDSQDIAITSVVDAQPMVTGADQPATLISWSRDGFIDPATQEPILWQVWRDDGSTTPIAVADGSRSNVVDDALGTNHPIGANGWRDFGGITGGTECVDDPGPTDGDGVLLVPGTPYQYSVEVVYRESDGAGGFCYFKTGRRQAVGLATPLPRPELRSPDPGATVSMPITFQFTSVRGGVLSVQLTYVVQLSIDPSFPDDADKTVTLPSFIELIAAGGQTVSSPTYDTSSFFPGANTIYWRVGAKNEADRPGPVADASGQRFIYSAVGMFVR